MIRYSRACGFYQDFFDRGLLLTRKLLNQGFILVKLKSSLRKFYGRHYDLSRSESGGFSALKSDSTHHFFTNACTKSGLLRFSQFSGCWLILSVYILEFWLSLCKIVRSSVILLLPLFDKCYENLCHKWPQTCSSCRKHFPAHSSCMAYHWVFSGIGVARSLV